MLARGIALASSAPIVALPIEEVFFANEGFLAVALTHLRSSGDPGPVLSFMLQVVEKSIDVCCLINRYLSEDLRDLALLTTSLEEQWRVFRVVLSQERVSTNDLSIALNLDVLFVTECLGRMRSVEVVRYANDLKYESSA
jgi:hypothetical protein